MTASHDPKRRALLKGAGITALTLGASFAMPARWLKPIAQVGVLPAHAQTTCACEPTFRVIIENPVGGSISPTVIQPGSTDVTFVDGGTHGGERWALYFDGDTSCLPETVMVTCTQYRDSLEDNIWIEDAAFSEQILGFPRSGAGTVGVGGTVVDSGVGHNAPTIRASSPSNSGRFNLRADCVQPMNITIREAGGVEG